MTIATLAGLLLLNQGALPDTPVSYSTTGQSTQAVVAGLAEQAKVPLMVASTMRSDVLVLHAEGMPLNQLLARVAQVTEGSWEASSGTWTLIPNRSAREAARTKKRAERLKKLREHLAVASKPPQADVSGDAVKPPDMMSSFMGGGDWRVVRMIMTLDLGTLVDLPEGGRIVYATNPNRMQRSFSPNARFIQEMIVEHNRQAEAQASLPKDAGDADTERMKAWMRRMGMDRELNVIREAPAKTLLIVENGGMFGSSTLSARLVLFDREGKVVLTETASLLLDERLESFGGPEEEGEVAPPVAKSAPKDDSPKLVLSPLSKDFSKLITGMMSEVMMGGQANISPEIKRVIARPLEHEPIGILVGDYLVQAAKYRKHSLIANLPDELIDIADSVSESTTINQFLNRLEASDSLIQGMESEVWTMAPADGEKTRRVRTDRAALQTLLATADVGGSLPLDAVADFAAKVPASSIQSSITMIAALVVAPSLMRYGIDDKGWDGLALYGMLSVSQRKSLEQGAQIPFAGLSTGVLSHANRMVYGADPRIEVGPDLWDNAELGGFFGMMFRGFGMGAGQDYREEPTEIAPSGLQSGGFIAAKVTQDFVFAAQGTSPVFAMMGLAGAEEIAMMSIYKEIGGAEMASIMPDLKEFKVGNRKTIRLSLQLSPEAAVRTTLQDDRMPADAPTYTLENMPANVKARMDKAREALKKLDMPFMDPGMFRRPPKPPAR